MRIKDQYDKHMQKNQIYTVLSSVYFRNGQFWLPRGKEINLKTK